MSMNTVGRLVVHAARVGLTHRRVAEEDFRDRHREQIQAVQDNFIGIVEWIKRVLAIIFAAGFLLATSIGIYGLFYITVMPGVHSSEHLYFDYTCKASSTDSAARACDANGTCASAPEQVANVVQTCSPVAKMDLFMRHAQWDGFHDQVLPEPLVQTRALNKRQAYLIEVALELPETETNVQAGMFGISVALLSANGTTLASSIRSARLPHESAWVGVLRKCTWLPGLLVGAVSESRTLIIPSFRHFIESNEHPLRFVVVKILARGNTWRETPIEIVSAELRVGLELNRFQSVLKECFFTCYTIGVSFLFVLQALAVFIGISILEEQQEAALQQQAGRSDGSFDYGYQYQEGDEQGENWDDLPVDENLESDGYDDRPVTPDHEVVVGDADGTNRTSAPEPGRHQGVGTEPTTSYSQHGETSTNQVFDQEG